MGGFCHTTEPCNINDTFPDCKYSPFHTSKRFMEHNIKLEVVLLLSLVLQEQYVFIHDAVLESLMCGNTQIPAASMKKALVRLSNVVPATDRSGFQTQFNVRGMNGHGMGWGLAWEHLMGAWLGNDES